MRTPALSSGEKQSFYEKNKPFFSFLADVSLLPLVRKRIRARFPCGGGKNLDFRGGGGNPFQSMRAARFCGFLLRLAALFSALPLLSGCGSGLPDGRINPLPIDIVRDDPSDKDKRRTYRRYRGRGGGGGSGGSDDGAPSAEDLWEEKCSQVRGLMASGEYEEAALRISPSDPAVSAFLSAYRSRDYNRASDLLNRLFSRSPCRQASPPAPAPGTPPVIVGGGGTSGGGSLTPSPPPPPSCQASTTSACPSSPPAECKLADITFVSVAVTASRTDVKYVKSPTLTLNL